MGKPKYYYNPDTCQYEPVKLRWTTALSYTVLLGITSSVLWVVILVAYGKLFPSEHQNFLQRENVALTNHFESVQAGLGSAAQLLSAVGVEEQQLYRKLFNEKEPKEDVKHHVDKGVSLLSTNPKQFRIAFSVVNDKFNQLKTKSVNTNIYYGNNLQISSNEISLMMSLPSLPPVSLSKVTNISGYGQRINPFHKGMHLHPGADFAVARGTEVVAAAPGKVVNISRSSIQAGYGNYIEIDHGNEIVTLYAHLDEINVRWGQQISKGDKIGTVGTSGGSIAPHLHFEISRAGSQVDPAWYLLQGVSSTDFANLIKDSSKKNQSLD